MAGATSKAAVVAGVTSSPGSPKTANTKWNEEAHRALIGTLLDVMDSADTKWRAHLDLMVESLAERGQQFSKEGIRHRASIDRRNPKHLKMPAVWDDARERDLLEEIYLVLSSRQPLSQEDKDAVAAGMKQRGYQNLTWNAIR
ncbi:hypothetical protein INS49_011718 [Diaporthe citri]|uniref:uncharacterized protein n=1 Tax=Diaporthe citri TaxID=83186 RepID=UPI001C7F1672|nr:uncharacterized protein INS49_011718 [Diaporthe citri]KAG6360653.1 hypothetical protein INS49_011718 [Diaporthe citri]